MDNLNKLSYNLSLCIINYNGERYLGESLDSVMNRKVIFNEILFIDNASEDNSVEIIKNRYPEISIIQLEQNFGPAYARNIGFNLAKSDMILFMDNDISLTDCTVSSLVEALMENSSSVAAMPRVFFASQNDKLQYDGADSHFMGHMIVHNENHPAVITTNKTRNIDSLITACFLVNKIKWGKENLFDDSFFFNYEDHDFGLRTRIKGHEILSVPSAHCYHREGTIGLSHREGGKYSRNRVYFLIRNRWLVILKNYQLKTIILLLPIFFVYEIFQLAGVIKKGWLKEWLKSILWIIANFNEVLQKRRIVQTSRIISDREILKGGVIPFFNDLAKGFLEQKAKASLDFIVNIYWSHIKGLI